MDRDAERSAVRDVTANYRRLDVRDWQRRGMLTPGAVFRWGWAEGRDGTVDVVVGEQAIALLYNTRYPGEEWERQAQRIELAATLTGFGIRRWLCCPQCQQHVAVLFLVGPHFLCRTCGDLRYITQRTDAATRLEWRMQRIWRGLGTGVPYRGTFPRRPKRMRRRTYKQLQEQYAALRARLVEVRSAQLLRSPLGSPTE